MNAHTISLIEDLVRTGADLVPEGGSEFAGYNAKKQSKYLLWRKNCLDAIGTFGAQGDAFSVKIGEDENGMYFYHSSALHVLTVLQEALDNARAAAAAEEDRIHRGTRA